RCGTSRSTGSRRSCLAAPPTRASATSAWARCRGSSAWRRRTMRRRCWWSWCRIPTSWSEPRALREVVGQPPGTHLWGDHVAGAHRQRELQEVVQPPVERPHERGPEAHHAGWHGHAPARSADAAEGGRHDGAPRHHLGAADRVLLAVAAYSLHDDPCRVRLVDRVRACVALADGQGEARARHVQALEEGAEEAGGPH